jgi:hypothetical protein
MMHSMMRLAMLTTSATLLGALPGCDPDEGERDDALDDALEFRCAVLGGCGSDGGSGTLTGPKGNTSFLGEIDGEGSYPLNELPLLGDSAGPITVLQIRGPRCQTEIGGYEGEFVSAPQPSLSVGPKGELGPLGVTDPATGMICQIEDDLWTHTRWTIRYDDGVTTFKTDLRLASIDTTADADGAPLYEFWVDTKPVPDPRIRLFPTCDADPAEPQLRFAAYLVPGLSLDPSSGNFTTNPNRAYLACLSGSVGKAWRWGYKSFLPAIGSEGHEVAHNAIRAEYCADDVAYTQPGTPVWFQSIFTEEGPDPSAPPAQSTWELEAVWSADPHAPAICVGTTRRPEHLPAPQDPFSCQEGASAFDIPRCTEAHLAHEDAVLATWAQTEPSLVPPVPPVPPQP